jgi:hypothetical protein
MRARRRRATALQSSACWRAARCLRSARWRFACWPPWRWPPGPALRTWTAAGMCGLGCCRCRRASRGSWQPALVAQQLQGRLAPVLLLVACAQGWALCLCQQAPGGSWQEMPSGCRGAGRLLRSPLLALGHSCRASRLLLGMLCTPAPPPTLHLCCAAGGLVGCLAAAAGRRAGRGALPPGAGRRPRAGGGRGGRGAGCLCRQRPRGGAAAGGVPRRRVCHWWAAAHPLGTAVHRCQRCQPPASAP